MGQDNETLNNFNISFSGKTDNTNIKNEQNIILNYSNDVNFPLYYKKVNDVQGIQTDRIGSKYIAIRDEEEIQALEDFIKYKKEKKKCFLKREKQDRTY